MSRKYGTLIALLCLIGILITPMATQAQANDPPMAVEERETEQSNSIVIETKPGVTRQGEDNQRGIEPVTGVLHIADDDAEDEERSRVAYAHSEYGIAYLLDDEIWVTFYRYDGAYINTYRITDGSGEASYSCDIAFEGSSAMFVVAWQNYDGDYDVYSRAVNPYLGVQGSIVAVANSAESEMGPSLDCNSMDGSCLVAFAYHGSSEYVQGRFMNVSSSGVSAPSHSPFTILSNGSYLRQVSVAWGWNSDTYGITAQVLASSGPDFGVYNHVHDTYNSSGSQTLHETTRMAASDWTDYDLIPTDLTYDPWTKNYLALMTHDFGGSGTDFDVRMKPFSGDDNYKVSDPIIVAYTGLSEESGTISFITDAFDAYFWDMGPDKIVVAYHLSGGDPETILTTIISGNRNSSDPQYTVPDESEHQVVKAALIWDSAVSDPAIAGGAGGGEYMVTWTDFNSNLATSSDDIYGMILKSETLNFIPLLLR
ncbi:MAG: hypothetical protein H0S79_15095 [Anaerolineaceae bacterium]|nr:hypothetical protein [Anaerolineaceae bacterium]